MMAVVSLTNHGRGSTAYGKWFTVDAAEIIVFKAFKPATDFCRHEGMTALCKA
jgi:hypothetical protein